MAVNVLRRKGVGSSDPLCNSCLKVPCAHGAKTKDSGVAGWRR